MPNGPNGFTPLISSTGVMIRIPILTAARVFHGLSHHRRPRSSPFGKRVRGRQHQDRNAPIGKRHRNLGGRNVGGQEFKGYSMPSQKWEARRGALIPRSRVHAFMKVPANPTVTHLPTATTGPRRRAMKLSRILDRLTLGGSAHNPAPLCPAA